MGVKNRVLLFTLLGFIGSIPGQSALPEDRPLSATGYAAGDENWENTFAFPGIKGGGINAVIRDGTSGNVYVGGYFTEAGGVYAQNVARWDGARWSALGAGLPWGVNALVTDSTGNLYAGGDGYDSQAYVARWNGSIWTTIGNATALEGPVINTLTFDGSGNLYAGGLFRTMNGIALGQIARWNGSVWSSVGSAVTGGAIFKIIAPQPNFIYICGGFNRSDGQWIGRVARWDGLVWNQLGDYPPQGNVCFDARLDTSGNLFASLATVDGLGTVGAIYRFDGVNWTLFGNTDDAPGALEFDSSGRLHAAGGIAKVGGVRQNKVARWDGSSWTTLGNPFADSSWLKALALGPLGEVYVGGVFCKAGSTNAINVARWNGSQWAGLGPGTGQGGASGKVVAADGRGNIYIGGSFSGVGDIPCGGTQVPANNIAMWNSSEWKALGTGTNGEVKALVVDKYGKLYAGGNFTTAGGVTANRVARWNGTQWSALGSGMELLVETLAADSQGRIYAGGLFKTAGGVAVDGIARWNGTAWERLPFNDNSTFCTTHGCEFTNLVIDRFGYLCMAGIFSIQGAWRQVGRWDGNLIMDLVPAAPVANITSLAVGTDGSFYVGSEGNYQYSIKGGVAKFDWISWSWSVLGSRFYYVNALTLDSNGNLFAGGGFMKLTGGPADFVARWNGYSWSGVGSGTNGEVYGLAVDANRLYLAGMFDKTGPVNSPGLGRWAIAGSPWLSINYGVGKPGSYFTVGGVGFPPSTTVNVLINGRPLSAAVAGGHAEGLTTSAAGFTTDSSGGLTFLLGTAQADLGGYSVTVSAGTIAAGVRFLLQSEALLLAQQGTGPILSVPGGIASNFFISLPLVLK